DRLNLEMISAAGSATRLPQAVGPPTTGQGGAPKTKAFWSAAASKAAPSASHHSLSYIAFSAVQAELVTIANGCSPETGPIGWATIIIGAISAPGRISRTTPRAGSASTTS